MYSTAGVAGAAGTGVVATGAGATVGAAVGTLGTRSVAGCGVAGVVGDRTLFTTTKNKTFGNFETKKFVIII